MRLLPVSQVLYHILAMYWLTLQVRPTTVKQRHSFALMETLRLCIAPKVCHSTIIGHLWVLQGSQFRSITSTWHKISDACAHGCSLDSKKSHSDWHISRHPSHSQLIHCILCDQQLLSTSIAHLVVECEQVTGHRIQSGLVPAIQKSRLRLLGRALDPGVEECIYLAPRWSLKWRSRSEPAVGWTGLWSMNLWGRGMIIGRWQHG
ncbi:hypothetical protein BASA62_007366 [Batrachochytrium salamandrivorans]|nr:hypothetical protein BASA62_007366 [Batrachochytrium salamandrivorans]